MKFRMILLASLEMDTADGMDSFHERLVHLP